MELNPLLFLISNISGPFFFCLCSQNRMFVVGIRPADTVHKVQKAPCLHLTKQDASLTVAAAHGEARISINTGNFKEKGVGGSAGGCTWF